jgi:GNAT superfamily N-acetyltransferase
MTDRTSDRGSRDDGLVLRAARAEDRAAIIPLLAAALGREDDPRFEQLYAWKHEENAFGASPTWVAADGDRVVGIRVLMRWEFVRPAADGTVESFRAVRAVDTATHPDYQGRGIFTRLTRHGIEALAADSPPGPVDFVFNTPNDQSRPGYLKMDWQEIGRLPVAVRPTSPAALVRMARARVPAERWSEPSTAGSAAADVLADADALDALLGAVRLAPGQLQTHRSVEFLRWRYGTPLLHYRAVVGDGGVANGLAIFRIRRRGAAREAALVELLVPGADRRRMRALVADVRRTAACDFVIALGSRPPGFVPFPRQGPILTWRHVRAERSDAPGLAAVGLTLGDIELF